MGYFTLTWAVCLWVDLTGECKVRRMCVSYINETDFLLFGLSVRQSGMAVNTQSGGTRRGSRFFLIWPNSWTPIGKEVYAQMGHVCCT